MARKNKKNNFLNKVYKLIIFVLAMVIVVGAFYIYNDYKNGDTEESIVTKIEFKDVGELVTQVAYTTTVWVIDEPREFFDTDLDIPFTRSYYVFSYDCEIRAGMDFTGITWDLDEENNIITVQLPAAKIISNEVDNDSLKVYIENESIFNQIKLEDINAAQSELKQKAENTAIGNGFLVNAKENAKTVIEGFFANEYDLDVYTIEYIDIEEEES